MGAVDKIKELEEQMAKTPEEQGHRAPLGLLKLK